MPYFIRIGYHPKNQSKITCKGYYIIKRTNTVTIKYGAIFVDKTIKKKFYWKGHHLPLITKKVFKNNILATKYYDAMIHQKCRKGYEELREGVRIYKKR